VRCGIGGVGLGLDNSSAAAADYHFCADEVARNFGRIAREEVRSQISHIRSCEYVLRLCGPLRLCAKLVFQSFLFAPTRKGPQRREGGILTNSRFQRQVSVAFFFSGDWGLCYKGYWLSQYGDGQ
jgi:hypothetical protein